MMSPSCYYHEFVSWTVIVQLQLIVKGLDIIFVHTNRLLLIEATVWGLDMKVGKAFGNNRNENVDVDQGCDTKERRLSGFVVTNMTVAPCGGMCVIGESIIDVRLWRIGRRGAVRMLRHKHNATSSRQRPATPRDCT